MSYRTNDRKTLFKRHNKVHSSKISHKCQDCSNKTKQASHLTRHIKTIHLNIRLFECPEPDYSEGDKSDEQSVGIHMLSHTGENICFSIGPEKST